MRRTNIYLSETQLDLLARMGQRRGAPVAQLVREAVDAWLEREGVRTVPEDEWRRRFDALLARRRRAAKSLKRSPDDIEGDVLDAVREVREARAARRR